MSRDHNGPRFRAKAANNLGKVPIGRTKLGLLLYVDYPWSRAIRKFGREPSGPEVGLGETQCQRMPTEPRFPRSPFLVSFRGADKPSAEGRLRRREPYHNLSLTDWSPPPPKMSAFIDLPLALCVTFRPNDKLGNIAVPHCLKLGPPGIRRRACVCKRLRALHGIAFEDVLWGANAQLVTSGGRAEQTALTANPKFSKHSFRYHSCGSDVAGGDRAPARQPRRISDGRRPNLESSTGHKQIQGAVVMGIAIALFEETTYDRPKL
jgi:hypothetical protein